jgi:hypothetical protein
VAAGVPAAEFGFERPADDLKALGVGLVKHPELFGTVGKWRGPGLVEMFQNPVHVLQVLPEPAPLCVRHV